MKIILKGLEGVDYVEISNHLIYQLKELEVERRENPKKHYSSIAQHLLKLLRNMKGREWNSQGALLRVYSGDYRLFLEKLYRSHIEEDFVDEESKEAIDSFTPIIKGQERNRPPPCMGVDDGISIMRN